MRIENSTAFGELVDVRRLDVLAAHESDIGATTIIDEKEDDIRSCWRFRRDTGEPGGGRRRASGSCGAFSWAGNG